MKGRDLIQNLRFNSFIDQSQECYSRETKEIRRKYGQDNKDSFSSKRERIYLDSRH